MAYRKRHGLILAGALALLGDGCHEAVPLDPIEGPSFGLDAVAVRVIPRTRSMRAGAQRQFAAEVSGSALGVTWSASGGTVDPTGLYTAPIAAGVYSVTATSIEDPTVSRSATVTVAEIAVQPAADSVEMKVDRAVRLVARAIGAADSEVDWRSDVGTLTPLGPHRVEYRPPGLPGVYHVTARSVVDTTKTATIKVVVRQRARVSIGRARCMMTVQATAITQDGTVDEVRFDDVYSNGEGPSDCDDGDNLTSYDAQAEADAFASSAEAGAEGAWAFQETRYGALGSADASALGSGSVGVASEERPWLSSSAHGSSNIEQWTDFEIEDEWATFILNASMSAVCANTTNNATVTFMLSGDPGVIDDFTWVCGGDTDATELHWNHRLPPGGYTLRVLLFSGGAGGALSTWPGNDDADANTSSSEAGFDYDFRIRT